MKDEAFALVKARIEKELGKGAILDTSKAAVAKRRATAAASTTIRSNKGSGGFKEIPRSGLHRQYGYY